MNVLSLFDGMSCGQQALERTGIKVNQYFASEIDKYAIQVTMANYPNTIQLGSVVDVDGYSLPKIDIIMGGSPCQSFSFAGKRKGMSTKDEQEILTLDHYLRLKSEGYEFEGQSYLFWEYMRLLNEVKPTYFLLENVMMGEKWEKVLSKAIGVNAIEINSALVSAQNRRRLYWTNIGMEAAGFFGDLESIIEQPKDREILLRDVLESEVDEKYFLSESNINRIVRHNNNSLDNNKSNCILAGYYKGGGRDQQYIKIDKQGNKKGNQNKASCFTAGGNSGGNHSDMDLIVHNTMPRSSTTGKGGTGPLSRTDGKTYCLDTGNTNAVEVRSGDFDFDGNFRPRENGKSGTLRARAREDESCSQLAQINSRIRRLTPIECERLQTVKDNYTNYVSDSQRYKMLGNGWTVEVITHIFKYIKQ
jgi:DNA (cytosine-5)-methyltransferase 3A